MRKNLRLTAVFISIAILISAVLPASSFSAKANRLLGDTDGDGVVAIMDVTLIQRHIIRLITLDEGSLEASDADGSGALEITDATFVQRWLIYVPAPYPIGEPMYSYDDEKTAAINALSARLAQTKAAAGGRPVMIRSYDTDRIELSSTAYTYDNALAAMAFISEDRRSDAQEILDAFVYVVAHDRYKPGRIRTAYAADTVYWLKDGQDSVKLPGWYDNIYGWLEDPQQVGSDTGNTSFAALALLQYDSVYGGDSYLATAKALMDWVIEECADSSDGFTAGCIGWPEEENGEEKLTYKSTENNIDAYVAFSRLYAVTGEQKYKNAADSALRFIKSMYNDEEGYFYTGTAVDGITPNTSLIPLDAQVWSAMALGTEFEPYVSALDMAASMKTPEGAYPFCKENKNGGFWCEGSAFTALMYKERGEFGSYAETMDALSDIQLESGLFPAASVDNLDTGIKLKNGDPWEYGKDPHIAPAAWFVFAVNGFDPYCFNS